MPTRSELLATDRDDEAIAREIGADRVIYQDLEALYDSIRACNPALTEFEASCFNGCYVTGDVTPEYLDRVENDRDASRGQSIDEREDMAV